MLTDNQLHRFMPACPDAWRQESPEPMNRALAVSGLERYGVLLPGTSMEVDGLLAAAAFGALFVDGNHVPEWGQHDAAFAAGHVAPGGLAAFHDHRRTDGAYQDYLDAATAAVVGRGWEMVDHLDNTTVFRLRPARR